MTVVSEGVTLDQLQDAIERLSEERQELWHRLSDGLDPGARDELKEIDAELERLWQELRSEQQRLHAIRIAAEEELGRLRRELVERVAAVEARERELADMLARVRSLGSSQW